jgi:hypothetical protein
MKSTPLDGTAAIRCSSVTSVSAIFLVVILVSASAVVPQSAAQGLNSAEKWVVTKAMTGEIADLSEQFRNENNRRLTAHFLEGLLTGTLSGVKLHRHGVQISGAIFDEPIDLENAQVPCEVSLNNCRFNKNVTFARANFASAFLFNNSAFKADASFYRLKVGGDAFFENTVFEGPVNFVGAEIANQFRADGAHFQNKEKTATFNNIKVGGDAFFENAVFEGPVNFVGAEIANEFRADGAHFQNKEQTATFNSMKGGVASFKNAVFEGPVNFVGAEIANEFRADGAHFQNKEKTATFGGMKVRGYAFFSDAVFEGPVHFIAADIAGNFEAERAKFQQAVDFWGMKVGGDGDIADAVFEGMAQFSRVNIASDFEAIGTKFQNKERGADFFGMKIAGNAVLTGATFEGPARFDAAEIAGSLKLGANFQHGASFQRMKVLGSASFYHAIFEEVADFRYADFGSLFLWPVSWPKHTPHSHMQGMNYKYFQAAAEELKSHKELLKLADQSSYTADVYSTLEEFFKRQGYHHDADTAFIAKKLRERKQYSSRGRGVRKYFLSGDWLRWLGSTMLYLLVGYGRRPWQAAIPCAGFIVLGWVLFSPKKMEPRNPGEAPGVYSRFWYSLGLFLPFVDLQADKVWKPKSDQTCLRNYMRVHILLGWILIPLVLAAITGLIK